MKKEGGKERMGIETTRMKERDKRYGRKERKRNLRERERERE